MNNEELKIKQIEYKGKWDDELKKEYLEHHRDKGFDLFKCSGSIRKG